MLDPNGGSWARMTTGTGEGAAAVGAASVDDAVMNKSSACAALTRCTRAAYVESVPSSLARRCVDTNK